MNNDALRKFLSPVGIQPPDVAAMELFHEQTKYHPSLMYKPGRRIGQYLFEGRAVLETSTNRKAYVLEGKQALPTPRPIDMPFSSALDARRSNRAFGSDPIDIQVVSDLLATASCSRLESSSLNPGITLAFRRYPSGGGLFPIEIYPIVLRVRDCAASVTHYDPREHRLDTLTEPCDKAALARSLNDYEGYLDNACMVIVLSACFERTTVKYGVRGYRFALLEAGLLGFLFTQAAAGLGLHSLHWGGYYDDQLNDLLGLDGVEIGRAVGRHSSIIQKYYSRSGPRRISSPMEGTAAERSTSRGRYSVTSGSNSSRCASMMPRMTLNDRPSVAGYTESTRPCAVPLSSLPRLTYSRGWSWRPWKKRTAPLTSSTSSLRMVRSRYGCPGHDTSIMPVSSLSTAWKMRSPFRVGSTPLETTVPMTVPCMPVSSDEMVAIVLASSYR